MSFLIGTTKCKKQVLYSIKTAFQKAHPLNLNSIPQKIHPRLVIFKLYPLSIKIHLSLLFFFQTNQEKKAKNNKRKI